MLERSHIPEAPWWVVQAVDKKRARLNCIDHLLKQFPYKEVQKSGVVLPQRERQSRLPPPPGAAAHARARNLLKRNARYLTS